MSDRDLVKLTDSLGRQLVPQNAATAGMSYAELVKRMEEAEGDER